ncbi:flagellar basal body-associated FliL family protein [Jannaschia seohaensis]|uniref:Flagellar protein FliL n=1 Tax=Jannaschia seohaensis TaxID=475081 RepID=A0A2Y9C811_9RHOB|nr:flagellar basal body-associated FliL family protein [Jannaschia seohaensis]PWJ17410.1 flagellar FliL protein [Jannaschia seohaensis]SSA47473.1 flagellar FliL protein [Jannaschia seohaensis]
MADATAELGEDQQKKGGLGRIGWAATVILALVLGGGGFWAAYTGMLSSGAAATPAADPAAGPAAPTFLELDPLTITVGGEGSIRQLRFRAFLELSAANGADLAALQPRILDIFATYLRALDLRTLENPAALLRIRAQLLRRLQLLTGPDAVSDLLIVDFVIT